MLIGLWTADIALCIRAWAVLSVSAYASGRLCGVSNGQTLEMLGTIAFLARLSSPEVFTRYTISIRTD